MLTTVSVKERPKTFEDAELEALFDEDPRQTQQELSSALGVTHHAIYKRLHALGMIQKQGTWWDQVDVIYYELLKPNETITEQRYRLQLLRLSRALRGKRPQYEQRHERVILQHDKHNAQPYVAKPIQTYLVTLKWEVLPNPPYSPDIAPSDYHLFWSTVHGLADQQFRLYEDIEKSKAPQRRWTWRSADGHTKNEIKYIIFDKTYIIKDLTVLNGYNTDSDHRLVGATIEINSKAERNTLLKPRELPSMELLKKHIDFCLKKLKRKLPPKEKKWKLIHSNKVPHKNSKQNDMPRGKGTAKYNKRNTTTYRDKEKHRKKLSRIFRVEQNHE
ncbi:hypothetical protein Trydic_g21466 [Trypoxylus dichotomus]